MKRIAYLLIFTSLRAMAQPSPSPSGYPPPVTFTADQDHKNMMDQLGIKALRPGPSGNESDPNHANYDESLANPCPILPDLLRTKKIEPKDASARPKKIHAIESPAA